MLGMKTMLIRSAVFCVLTPVLITCLSGCVSYRPVRAWGSAVEVYDYADKNYQVGDVAILGQAVIMSASFIWDTPGEAGFHSVRWELYKGDQCIRKDPRRMQLFAHSPHTVSLQLDATALGEGTFRGVLYVDDLDAATNSITIRSEK